MNSTALITAEQRKLELSEREEFAKMAADIQEDKEKELASQLAVRDRLMRRLSHARVETAFRDDLGEFKIATRLMKASERERFLQLNKMLSEAKSDTDQYNEAMKGLKELAGDLCLTPGLGKDYWASGEASDDVVMTLLLSTMNGAGRAVMQDVERFRPK